MEKIPQVSIIIVSFNTKKLTLDAILSVQKYVKTAFEIIVVDNASTDGSVDAFKKLGGKIRFIQNSKNVGFAAANNQGIKVAKGEYLLLLNSDTLLIEDCITPSIRYLENNPKVGIVSCKLLNSDKSTQPTGGFFPNVINTALWMYGIDDLPLLSSLVKSLHPKPSFYSKDQDLDWVTGAFFLFRKELIKSVGLIDEEYFMYVEELDYCFRAKEKGWGVYFLNSPKLIHYGGASARSGFAIENELKNQLLFFKKHNNHLETSLVRFFFKTGSLLRAVLYAILGKEYERKIYLNLSQTL